MSFRDTGRMDSLSHVEDGESNIQQSEDSMPLLPPRPFLTDQTQYSSENRDMFVGRGQAEENHQLNGAHWTYQMPDEYSQYSDTTGFVNEQAHEYSQYRYQSDNTAFENDQTQGERRYQLYNRAFKNNRTQGEFYQQTDPRYQGDTCGHHGGDQSDATAYGSDGTNHETSGNRTQNDATTSESGHTKDEYSDYMPRSNATVYDSDRTKDGNSEDRSRSDESTNSDTFRDNSEDEPLISGETSDTDSNRTSKKKSTGGPCRCCRAIYKIIRNFIRSPPHQHQALKSVIAFPIGVAIAVGLYYILLEPIKLPPKTRAVIGGVFGLLVALGFGLSTTVRCTILLVGPTVFGRTGRSYIMAYAIMYLVAGPIQNIIHNAGEMTNSLTCVTELLANHTAEKWKFRLKPVQDAMKQIQKEGFLLRRVGKVVDEAFQPIKEEIEGIELVNEMKQRTQKVDKATGKNDRSSKIESRHKLPPSATADKALENKWEKKLDYRCEDVFSTGVTRCRTWFNDMERKCMDSLWILGYILCLPLKLTVICEIVRVMPGAIGLDCDSEKVVNPGLGETYVASSEMIDNMESGYTVNIQYKVVADPEAIDFMNAEQARKQTMHEFENKRATTDFILTFLQRVLAFMFVLMFYKAHQYQKNYLSNIKHDNVYITWYFRHIDRRRHIQDKTTLLPLKKLEEKQVVYPTTLKLMAAEKRKLVTGTMKLLFRAAVTAIVLMMDFLLFWVLELIRRHSKIDYVQEGQQDMDITVYGKGFISEIVRLFLVNFNIKHEIKNLSTNADCLPNPIQLSRKAIIIIYSIYGGIWLLVYLEAYGLRLRREVCKFFYRKREKKRVLYLYNNMLKKRRNFLRRMRHRVRRQVKARTLQHSAGVLQSLSREFPRLCGWLGKCTSAQDRTCLICQDPRGPNFVKCETPTCGFEYCEDCWYDVKMRCYSCHCKGKPDSDVSFSSTEESELTDDDPFD